MVNLQSAIPAIGEGGVFGRVIPGAVYLIFDILGDVVCVPRMARIVRVVAPGVPHHLTKRGNRRIQTFFSDDDYRDYISLITDSWREW